jgi:hypothetical protein
MRKIEQISIGAADRERLERLVRDRNTPQKVVWRARIVLLASDGLAATAISAAVGNFVRSCQTPMLVLPDDTAAHAYQVAIDVASLAPNAECARKAGKE